MFDLAREIKEAQERLHRSIGQKCRHELVRIRVMAAWHLGLVIDGMNTIRIRLPQPYRRNPLAEIIDGQSKNGIRFRKWSGPAQEGAWR